MPQQTTTNRTVSSMMDAAAALMNDTEKQVWTNTVQLPYFKIACRELREHMASANMQLTEGTSEVITIDAGVTEINPPINGAGTNAAPTYPADLLEVQKVWARLSGSSDPFIEVNYVRGLDQTLAGINYDGIFQYTFQDNKIKFWPSTTDQEIKLEYVRSVIPDLVTDDSIISVINAETFLIYRTAALLSEFVGENPSRSQSLNANAIMAVDRMTTIDVKGTQKVGTRRRPFLASLKARGRTW